MGGRPHDHHPNTLKELLSSILLSRTNISITYQPPKDPGGFTTFRLASVMRPVDPLFTVGRCPVPWGNDPTTTGSGLADKHGTIISSLEALSNSMTGGEGLDFYWA